SVKVKASNACGSSSYKSLSVAITCRNTMEEEIFSVRAIPGSPGRFAIRFVTSEGGDVRISLIDLTGRIIFSENMEALSGENYLLVDAGVIPAGIKLMRIDGNDLS